MNGEREAAIQRLQGAIKRRNIQPQYNRYLQSARQNYDDATLKQMSRPYRFDELKAAWTDKVREMTIYNMPVNKLKKHQLYHELLNVNYDFSNLVRQDAPPVAGVRRRGRPPRAPNAEPVAPVAPRRRGRPPRVPAVL